MTMTIPAGFVERTDTSDFLRLCGPFYEQRENGRLTALALGIQDKHRNLRNITHGGMLMTLADSVLGDFIVDNYDEEIGLVTVSMSSEFLRPAQVNDWVVARASINKKGRRLAFAECTLSVNDTPIFRASGVFALVEPQGRR